jgi:hypothetical protein
LNSALKNSPHFLCFNFVPLKTIFKPSIGKEDFTGTTSGPAFVCVYAGQPSKNLDFKDYYSKSMVEDPWKNM